MMQVIWFLRSLLHHKQAGILITVMMMMMAAMNMKTAEYESPRSPLQLDSDLLPPLVLSGTPG